MSHNKLFTAMADPGFYPHGPEAVEVIHTHISAVFVAPPYVYKVKKAKDLGFLDFSSLDKRRFYCLEELELNRRGSEDVYLDVVAIVPDGEGYALADLAAEGAVEYALKLRYLEPAGFLDEMIAADAVDAAHMEALARHLAAFFAAAPATAEAAADGAPDRLLARMDENERQLQPLTTSWIAPALLAWQHAFGHGFADRFAALLADRQQGGRIRDGHGDLHCQHVHFAGAAPDGAINLIDCIEFAAGYRHNDTASELAFLVMDLELRDRRSLADDLVRAMADHDEDPHREVLLPFYMAYRAMVRAKVEALRGGSTEVPEFERAEAIAAAKECLVAATRYALVGREPAVIACCGPAGAGKSTLMDRLAELTGTARHASDLVRRGLAGLPPDSPSASGRDTGIYSEEMTDRTYATVAHFAVRDAERHGLGLCDATFLTAERRAELAELCRERRVRLWWLALDAEPDLLHQRVAERPAGESEANTQVLADQLRRWQPPAAHEGTAVITLSGVESPQTVGDRIVRAHLDLLERS